MTDKELASNIEKILEYKRAIIEISQKIVDSTDGEISFCDAETRYLQIYNY